MAVGTRQDEMAGTELVEVSAGGAGDVAVDRETVVVGEVDRGVGLVGIDVHADAGAGAGEGDVRHPAVDAGEAVQFVPKEAFFDGGHEHSDYP